MTSRGNTAAKSRLTFGLKYLVALNFRYPVILLVAVCIAVSGAHAQKELSISQVQGNKNASAFLGENVRVSGIVTARSKTGFFIQTPDDKTDADKATSEGVFVFTKDDPPNEAGVGNLVSVTGMVEEFRPRSEPLTLPITEISMRADRDSIRVVSRSNALPKPIVLTSADFNSNQIDQLEKYEGMRVQIEALTVVGPTDGRVDIKTSSAESSGAFFGVVKGMQRPFREPGLEIYEILFADDKEKSMLKTDQPKMAVFDTNPERIRIESSGQPGSQPINVATGAEVRNLTGVLHYSYRTNTLMLDPDSKPVITGSMKPNPLPVPNDRQISIAGMNLENFFDDRDDPGIQEEVVSEDGFNKRLKKISLAIRDFMKMPDVIGVLEAENLSALKRLADKLNADAVASGKPDPKYLAYLIDGNDGRGIDNGFLVKGSRVKVIETKQFGKDDKYPNPYTKEDNFLNDRPPLMLRVSVADPKTNQPFGFTIVVNHLKSFLGYNDPRQQDNVRLKKRLQAEFLAKFVQERQKVNPQERIILLGDFNAFQFSDGVLDLIGTIKGEPSAQNAVLNFSEDLVNPNLSDLVDVIETKQRYSYVFDGNAQVLDHILISETLRKHINGFGFARINSDFPEVYRNDDSRPERFSDHDPAVAYFTFHDVTAVPPR